MVITGCNRNLILFNFQCESSILIIINSLFYLTEFHRQSIKSIVVSLVFDFWRVSSWAAERVSVLDLLNGLSGRSELCEVILQIRLWINCVMTFHSAPNIFRSIHSFVDNCDLLGTSFSEKIMYWGHCIVPWISFRKIFLTFSVKVFL